MNEQTGETRLAAAAVVVVVVAVNVEYQKRGKRWTRMIGKKKKQSSGVMAAAAKRGMVPPRSGKWPVAAVLTVAAAISSFRRHLPTGHAN